MKRINNSKETIEKILTISMELFNQKGYDKTSMQDIIDKLGMSKGAIYHHFKSKEEILDTVILKHSENAKETLTKWISEMEGYTAKEKLINILRKNMFSEEFHSLDNVFYTQCKDPKFILKNMQDCINESAPIFSEIMKEGLKDGSINTDYPDECSEVFFLLINIWCDFNIFKCDENKLLKRLKFVQQLMKSMGADIISDEFLDEISSYISDMKCD